MQELHAPVDASGNNVLVKEADERLHTHVCLINIDQRKHGTMLENLNS